MRFVIRIRTSLSLLTLLLLAGVAAPPASAADDAPRNGRVVLDLEERWRRGGEDDDLFFGLVIQAVPGEGDELFLLDSQLNEIFVLSAADGTHLRSVGREGEGPGEFRRAADLLRRPDGVLGVVQRFPGSVVLITPDDVPAGTVLPGDPTTGGRDMLSGARPAEDGYVFSGAHMTRTDSGRLRRYFLALYDPQGAPRVEYLGRDDAFDFSSRSFREIDTDFPDAGRWSTDAAGRVYVAAERDRYAVDVHAPDGTLLRTVSRPYEPLARDDEEMARLKRRWEAGRQFQRFGTEQVFSPDFRAIVRIEVRGDGELWVLPSRGVRGQPAGVLQTWDVFSPDGVFDRQVALRAPGDGLRDRLIWVDESHVLVIHGFLDAFEAAFGGGGEADEEALMDATPMEVVSYAIR